MLKRLFKLISTRNDTERQQPLIIPRDQHSVSRKLLSQAAIRVMKQLNQHGYEAYLVGGGVRDLLLGGHPKDFDVATNAKPEQVKSLFRSARIIGRRFRIVHVRFGREMIEVTTFRGHHEAARNEHGMVLRDNVYGNVHSDAVRRDFTVNALYYSLDGFAVHDYTGGLKDLQKRTLRMIGNPKERYEEDPVRMLRAARFAAKLGFNIEKNTAAPIKSMAPLLANIPPARLFEEILKLFLNGSATATFGLLREYGLYDQLFPDSGALIAAGDEKALAMAELCMSNTDKRIRAGKSITPAFIFAALLWPSQQALMAQNRGMPKGQAFAQAASDAVGHQLARISIPKRFLIPMREIWDLQHRLTLRGGGRAFKMLDHPRFRAAYDFLLLREDAGEDMDGLGNWWTQFQAADETEQQSMVKAIKGPTKKRNSRRPPRKKRSPE
ncbi:polynucleotide adenylyltransferase PcnB [Gilvimarinus agarilyticus]|uniref:polynucleotide adenylyltransferase PcnB n=1 Tax=unclassified Gilvimarinus TaxID=2642066 RepID=UPI001C0A55AE|nr:MULTISPECIES: polynucleotide adenylyltransferase PcnB [unclassified Gilvimarinus]MBU2886104.1 polynucleotide adenylyltransferase PcnB [Gilvimarinus agarilyticus]MDO6570814.1 polynucleotide adenylyltransferase PcnB [Gilvimarinus sp. 2_MG-2023]MDO6746982.1 polynucleotide adenylyltransferase PcnB [Gilvimarinus sp. 1_MG-2023]